MNFKNMNRMNIDILKLTNKPYFHMVTSEEFNLTYNYKSIDEQYDEFKIVVIEGMNCKEKENVFKVFKEAFSFPDYFGQNWMAFDECINDLDWLSLNGCILIIKDADKVLVDYEKELETFYCILRDSSIEWNEGRNYDDFPTSPTPFHVILVVNKENLISLRAKLEKIEIELT